jgi:hypothetical protein
LTGGGETARLWNEEGECLQVLTGHEKTLLLLLLCLLLAPAADTAIAGILEKRGRGDVA